MALTINAEELVFFTSAGRGSNGSDLPDTKFTVSLSQEDAQWLVHNVLSDTKRASQEWRRDVMTPAELAEQDAAGEWSGSLTELCEHTKRKLGGTRKGFGTGPKRVTTVEDHVNAIRLKVDKDGKLDDATKAALKALLDD